MTKKIGVLFAEGFEEIEALAPVDILRRAGFDVELIGVREKSVTGSHHITVMMDSTLEERMGQQYDLVMLPGGLPGATNLRDDQRVIDFIQKHAQSQAFVAGICAAPIVLERAGLLKDKRFTAYPGFEQQVESSRHYTQAVVERDGNVITSRGAGAALEFGFYLAEQLGYDTTELREGMRYNETIAWYTK